MRPSLSLHPLPRLCFSVALVVCCLAWSRPAHAVEQTAGNGYYTVVVEDAPGSAGVGLFAVETGPSHPAGAGLPVLFRGDAAGNKHGSYLTVRSWTTGTDYVQTQSPVASGNLISRLDSLGSVQPLTGGFRTTYDVTSPDSLRIVSDVSVSGEGASSTIELRTEVSNTGAQPLAVGLRYLLDFDLAGDDGPAFGAWDAAVLGKDEASLGAVAETRVESTPGSPLLKIFGRSDPLPDDVQFAFWPDAAAAAFDYGPERRDIASAGGLDDSAALYYFGATPDAALTLAPGEKTEFTVALAGASLHGSAPPVPPEPQPEPKRLPVSLPDTGRP